MRKNTEPMESLLAGYVEGDLDSRQRAAVERYLAANPAQQRMVQRMAEVRGLLRSLPRETAPSELHEDVQAQLERGLLLGEPIDDEVEAAEMRIDRWSQLRAAAAIAVLVAGVAAAIYWALPEDRQRPDAVAIAPVDVPRIEEAEEQGSRREKETMAGGLAFNRLNTPSADADRAGPASADGGGGGGSPGPSGNAEPASPSVSANESSDAFAWKPLRLDDPTSPDVSALESPQDDPLLIPASVLAVSNNADMLVMVRTDDAGSANAAAVSYFRANRIVAASLPSSEELRLGQEAGRPLAEGGHSPTGDAPAVPAPTPTTAPAADAVALADAAERKREDPVMQARRTLSDDQVLLARAVTVQQAAELGKSVAAETARQGKASRSADIRLYARAPAEMAEPFARQSPQQQQLPAAQLDSPDQERQPGGQRDRRQAVEDDALRELALGEVIIVSIPSPEGGVRESRVRIADDGAIELPSLGRIPAAGLTTTQLVELIVARLGDKPQVAAQKAGEVVTVRRVPMPDVPRMGWNNAPRLRERNESDRLDLLLIIRAEPSETPSTAPSTAPAADR